MPVFDFTRMPIRALQTIEAALSLEDKTSLASTCWTMRATHRHLNPESHHLDEFLCDFESHKSLRVFDTLRAIRKLDNGNRFLEDLRIRRVTDIMMVVGSDQDYQALKARSSDEREVLWLGAWPNMYFWKPGPTHAWRLECRAASYQDRSHVGTPSTKSIGAACRALYPWLGKIDVTKVARRCKGSLAPLTETRAVRIEGRPRQPHRRRKPLQPVTTL